jgi:hypothetical protein
VKAAFSCKIEGEGQAEKEHRRYVVLPLESLRKAEIKAVFYEAGQVDYIDVKNAERAKQPKKVHNLGEGVEKTFFRFKDFYSGNKVEKYHSKAQKENVV